MEQAMPVILLWGIPILLLGGGFVVYRIVGG
jgi:LPXTG-motif cell wall-anchored protein